MDRPPARRPARPRARALAPASLLLAVLVWGGVAALQVRSAAEEARRGVDRLERTQADTGDLVSLVVDGGEGADVVRRELDAATADLEGAQASIDSPLLLPARVLPVVGRQLRSVDALLSAGTTVTSALATAIGELRDVADRPTEGPASRLAAAEDSAAALERLRPALDHPDLGPDRGLLTPVAEARNRFSSALATTRDTVDGALVSVRGVASFLRGPNTYLVLASNNAEMRAGSGMFLQAGTMTVRDGAIELSEFVPTSELRLDSPGTTLDPDVAARWGSLAPDREWRNLNLTPRFDESARMAADLWAASGRGEVDGVLSMDVAALVDLLALTGPVDVDGRRLDADSARDLLLVGQYREVPDTDERRELLGRVVAAAFTAFDQRPVPVSGLVRLFRDAGAGRHLLAWSSDPVQQAAWVELGVSGTVPADAVVLSVLNRGGTKLDPYLRVDATMTVRERGDHRRMEVRVQIDNTAPPGLPRYVAGPVTVTGATDPGDYVGIVALTVPGSATAPSISTEGFAVVGDDGDTRVVGGNVLVPAGTSTVVEIGVDLPLELDTLWILPGARLPATTWNVDGETWTERRPRPIDLEAVGSDRG